MAKSLWLASACMLTLVPCAAFAQEQEQEAAQDAAAQEEVAGEGEIIITATRRAQALSDVPIAVSALTGEQLQNSGVTDIRALNQLAPSLIVSGATSEVNFTARIRGVGTVGENPGLESSVALFIDGVYRSRTGAGLTELGEVERIEVLRGPQGTLFGRNASAGLLNIVTVGPKFDIGGYASATYGNYDYLRIDGGVTGPLFGDKVAARIDGVWQQRDGFIKNVTPGEKDINDRDRWLVRGQLLFEPTDDISFRLIGDFSQRDENCCGAVNLSPNRNLVRTSPAGGATILPNTLLPLLQTLGANIPTATGGERFVRAQSTTPGFDYRSDTDDWGLSGELNWNFGDANLTSITAYRDYHNAQGQDSDFNALDILRRTDLDREFQTFTQEFRLQGTAFNDRLDWLVGAYYADEKLFVDDDIKYGADSERYFNCLIAPSFGAALFNPASPTCSNNPAWIGFQGLAGFFGVNRLPGTGTVRNTFNQDSRNYAFFTHNVFQIVPDKLSLTVGLRYTNEKKELESTVDMNNNLCTAMVTQANPYPAAFLPTFQALSCVINQTAPSFSHSDPNTTRKEDEWTGTAVLSFKPNPDVMVYGSFSRGYKAGGFNLDNAALDRACSTTTGTPAMIAACNALLTRPANTPGNGRPEASDLQFEAEKVDAYEIGVKWDGPGIDVNAAMFRQDFDDFQLNTFNGINFEVTNIASCKDDLGGGDQDGSALTGACPSNRLRPGVRSEGFELEVYAYPAPNFSVGGGFTYLDSRYRHNLVGTGGRPLSPVLFQLPGRRLFSSEYSITGSAAWTPQVGDTMSALVYLDFRYQSDTNTGSDLDLEKVQDGYGLVNGRLGLYGEDKRWGIELWGQNLLDKKYQQIAADTPLQGSGTYRAVAAPAATGLAGTANQLFIAFPGEPRTYGVTVRTKF